MNSRSLIFMAILPILLTKLLLADNITVHGQTIDGSTGQPLVGVNISAGETGTVSDDGGNFHLTVPEDTQLLFSHIGYSDRTVTATVNRLLVRLQPRVVPGTEITVSATRAVAGVTPVAFSTVTAAEINRRNTVQDVPMLLAAEPGVHAYSESGNGTGYSYVSIRGFDQSRIAVMLDNVPLNDNESHQVYWVDHADILSDADEVQIQRGIGNSLYGSSAFGGSINVSTGLTSSRRSLTATFGSGSYNTSKQSLKVASGPMMKDKLHLLARYSQVESDGYRDYHESRQKAFFIGGQYISGAVTNQFRALIGYENTDLAWWGVGADVINDRKDRRSGWPAYTDDFLQQIYSLNSEWRISDNLNFANVTYLVRGEGYYENSESEGFDLTAGDDSSTVSDYQGFLDEFNLNQWWGGADSTQSLAFTRRKWIVNNYYGIIPTLTYSKDDLRVDAGAEIRFYTGDHFGEIHNLKVYSQVAPLASVAEYYSYLGQKRLITGFAHAMYLLPFNLRASVDLQVQNIHWTLDQEQIGLATGHQLSADWNFVNPRAGLVWQVAPEISLFANYGRAHKEPADNQIIEADDVFSEPVMAAAEKINDFELGTNFQLAGITGSLNLYHIGFKNEQLKNIDVEQEGEYEYYSAAGTVHQGLEFELGGTFFGWLRAGLNGSFNRHVFSSGGAADDFLPGIPRYRLNGWLRMDIDDNWQAAVDTRFIGPQNLPAAGAPVSEEMIDAFSVTDLSVGYSFGLFEIDLWVNNIFDTLYSTNGFDWDGWLYYWPGATRNAYLSLAVNL